METKRVAARTAGLTAAARRVTVYLHECCPCLKTLIPNLHLLVVDSLPQPCSAVLLLPPDRLGAQELFMHFRTSQVCDKSDSMGVIGDPSLSKYYRNIRNQGSEWKISTNLQQFTLSHRGGSCKAFA